MSAMTSPTRRRPLIWTVLGLVVVAFVAGMVVFQPWKLFVDRTVDDAAPTASAPAASADPAAAPVELLRGVLISHEHESSGSVVVLELPDGSRVLRLEDLDTSDGPLLKVWLTDAPVIDGTDGWYVFDDGAYVDLGELRGNVGSSNYAIPADVDLDALTSMTIWCDNFDVSFAAAELAPVT